MKPRSLKHAERGELPEKIGCQTNPVRILTRSTKSDPKRRHSASFYVLFATSCQLFRLVQHVRRVPILRRSTQSDSKRTKRPHSASFYTRELSATACRFFGLGACQCAFTFRGVVASGRLHKQMTRFTLSAPDLLIVI